MSRALLNTVAVVLHTRECQARRSFRRCEAGAQLVRLDLDIIGEGLEAVAGP